jgi:predicted CoA-substrate-specific enzyme activase
MWSLGVNVGALTVKVVAVCGDTRQARVVPHQGRPLEVLKELLAEPEFAKAEYFGVSGHRGHISEVAAIQRALRELPGDFDAVVSLGGESFLVYLLADRRITNVLSHNKCAAGSGEFFVQQIGRMGLGLEEAIRLSFHGKVVPLASRCSVHCKSDITHKLNRQEATPEDILHTLHDSMAGKVVALLEKTPPAGPMVLGVDAGSTTTKAVLLDPATRGVVASHYTRTNGDPVAAVRKCLRSLAGQVGGARVSLVGTTGSARELIGAYLGTEHVYNEISAQAAGATHFAPDVDTIFEIGGQDSKYIYLRNGVPIDYAMNNACSAGTGSFLEESAQGDLGIAVADIADLALAGPAPVQFKATCAAFINSDIRLAQQEGHSRENIVAGLVYAIAANYLNRVKGARYVGKKVFLQGGVALNRAVGHAFAHCVGRQIVIPRSPELLGALGVGLLTLERSEHGLQVEPLRAFDPRELLALAAPEMKLVGRFTCGACKLACRIDRFEVAGRRFPFGGRCSLYENVWKRRSRTAPAPDLVEHRARLLFGSAAQKPTANAPCEQAVTAHSTSKLKVRSSGFKVQGFLPASMLHPPTTSPSASGSQLSTLNHQLPVGIPRALTTHSLFPLYSIFFTGLGLEVVLSKVDPRGELKSYSGFCFPAQIAHGALLDLAGRGVDLVFLPHIVRMPQDNPCRDSYLCPVTQAGPYFLAKAFPDLRFLSPVLDFTRGYEASLALVDLAVREFGKPRQLAEQAWATAVRAQTEVERALGELGQRALEEAVRAGKPAILLAGRSYNAFTPEGSQSVGKKLSSMGVNVIPADCLAPIGEGPTVWYAANQILNAVALAKQHPNLFLLCVSNFSCTIDAFTHAMLASELGSKPYLILEIDAHTADGGVQTRLEAFLDIVANYREAQARPSQPFTPCRLASDGQVIRANGAPVRLTDPRVRIYFPNFSQYHAQAFAMAARCLGLHPGAVLPLGPHPTRARPPAHLGPRMPAAADLHRPTPSHQRAKSAR